MQKLITVETKATPVLAVLTREERKVTPVKLGTFLLFSDKDGDIDIAFIVSAGYKKYVAVNLQGLRHGDVININSNRELTEEELTNLFSGELPENIGVITPAEVLKFLTDAESKSGDFSPFNLVEHFEEMQTASDAVKTVGEDEVIPPPTEPVVVKERDILKDPRDGDRFSIKHAGTVYYRTVSDVGGRFEVCNESGMPVCQLPENKDLYSSSSISDFTVLHRAPA